jgi:glycosyltransferase involved in cell wall biosynthesis
LADGKLKVALVTDAIGPFHQGGKEVRYSEVAHRLAQSHSVVVYTMNWWRGERTTTINGVTFRAIAPVLPLYSGGRRSIRQAIVFALSCLRLLREDFDVIEADHMPYMPLFTLRIVATLRRRRLVVTWHECWGRDYWEEYLGRIGRIGWWFEKAAMQLPDAVIAASPETRDRLLSDVPTRVEVVSAPNGVDLARIHSTPPAADAPDVITVGRLLPHKRIDLLLDALALLRDERHALTALVVGSGPLLETLRSQARRLGLEHAVRFRQDVSDVGELYGLIKGARLAVFPSEREGFGIAVLEALACETPVITTAAPDNLARHLVHDAGGGVVCQSDAAAIAQAMEAILDSEPQKLGAADPQWLAQYDWNTITARIAAVLA